MNAPLRGLTLAGNMPEPTTRTRYQFDRFTVDAGQRLFFQQGSDVPVDLPPRAFEALLHFVERPGELLSKKQLMKALWPDVVVEENNLNQVISLLRRVLGEKPSEHRFIVTAPGRGYRFVAAVRTVDAQRDASAVADELSLAVLPFTNTSATEGQEFLGEAFAADLIRALSLRPRLRVTAQSSSFVFRNGQTDIPTIARTLNVKRVLVGQLSFTGDRIGVSASLLDGDSGKTLWSTTLQRDFAHIAALQADLSKQVGLATDSSMGVAADPTAAVEPEAYLRYLRALSLSLRPSAESARRIIDLLSEALALAPDFARARSRLAIEYTTCVMFGFPVPGALDRARHEAAAALAQDDRYGETHCAAAVIDCLSGAWSRAEERFRLAQTLTADPLVSGLRCAYLTFSVGQLQRALQQAEYTLRVAPTHPIGVQMLAAVHDALGQDEQARRYAELAVELGQSPQLAPLADVFGQLALRAGREADAATCMLATLPPRFAAGAGREAIERLCRADRHPEVAAEAAVALQELERSLDESERDPPMRKRLILWYARIGALDPAYDLALRCLDDYAREGTVGGAWGVLWLPEMRAFRGDARFQPFVRRLRLFEYWSEYGPPDGYALAGESLIPAES